MATKKTLLSQKGYEELLAKLSHMKIVEMVESAQKIKEARELGDLSENSEYITAREEQGLLQADIEKLEALLRNVEIVEDDLVGGDVVQVGSQVEVLDLEENDSWTFRLVGTLEANVSEGKISNESPLGGAMLGKKAGDVVEVDATAGHLRYKIVRIV